jgi:phosphocarrier protein HPr
MKAIPPWRDKMSGLDPRAIVDINMTANLFASSIVLRVDSKHIDVKSILGLSLTLVTNYEYVLEIHGSDEDQARAAMAEVFAKHGLRATFL